jgi:hypothetical protein
MLTLLFEFPAECNAPCASPASRAHLAFGPVGWLPVAVKVE